MFNDEFFEFDQQPDNGDEGFQVISVSELTRCIRLTLEADNLFSDLWVQGEVSNLTRHANGHIYFSLKDDAALLRCVIWAGNTRSIKHEIKSGSSLIVHGQISLYDKQGQYQLTIDKVMSNGVGDLYEAFEKLKKKLQDEGLFDEAHKKPLPEFPRKIAMITSPTGAVIQDMVCIARRRMPSVNLLLIPTLVQGDAAPAAIVKSIRTADECSGADVIIVGRGGGSLEDLWGFNDESVVRAIYDCNTPIVSAVGHQTDFTLADFAADLRAPTPSAAMELVLQDRDEVCGRIGNMADILASSMRSIIAGRRMELDGIMRSTQLRFPERMIQERWQTLDILQERMGDRYRKQLSSSEGRLGALSGRLISLSPLNVLSRGYSVLRRGDGTVIRSVNDVINGECTHTLISDGTLISKVIDTKEGWE
ncbi:MAG: exodeoxyribonuclease VII large subunit [Armatimonadota bacterium]